MYNVFIDGSAGTTGLKIVERLSARKDLNLILLSEEKRKDINARKEAINKADVAFLCLPDQASIEAVSLIENDNVKVIDTSTAHRTNADWAYGFPEIEGLRNKIVKSKRIANPGCHASGFIALVSPLINAGVIDKSINLSCFSITGYTGGGKKMIAEYESEEKPVFYGAPRQYGLSQTHKHLPEMVAVCGLENQPIFCPIVADFDRGMEVAVPLFAKDLKTNLQGVKDIYKNAYNGKMVKFKDCADENGFLSSMSMRGRDDMEISVFGNDQRIILCARFDNLGKGASGAAIQNMNLLLGIDETTGLNVGE
ncbi:MAG: N-acetyl-gamma-glutamyl-phosphate reductase [Clostridiales bacterium]|nr:N-acetyl-gamma-glutamyl-phosphate reductase [Clostridiales bacterium]